MVLQQPLDAVVVAAAFFAGRQRYNKIPVRLIPFLLEAHERGDEDRVAILDIHRAAAVEEAVLLGEGEGIERPVLAPRLDDVEMREQDDRLLRAGFRTAQAGDEVVVLRIRGTDHLNIGGGKATVNQPVGDRLRGDRRAAARPGRVDVDELFEDVARPLVIDAELLCRLRRQRTREERCRNKAEYHWTIHEQQSTRWGLRQVPPTQSKRITRESHGVPAFL